MLIFSNRATKQVSSLKKKNKKYLLKVSQLLLDIESDPKEGRGNPKLLTDYRYGEDVWSRRVDQKNRIVYKITADQIEVFSIIGHYVDK